MESNASQTELTQEMKLSYKIDSDKEMQIFLSNDKLSNQNVINNPVSPEALDLGVNNIEIPLPKK